MQTSNYISAFRIGHHMGGRVAILKKRTLRVEMMKFLICGRSLREEWRLTSDVIVIIENINQNEERAN